MLRYPDGRREQIALSANAKLMVCKFPESPETPCSCCFLGFLRDVCNVTECCCPHPHPTPQALVRHVQSNGYPNERFELVTNFPRRKLAHLDYDITLQEAGLCPQETVFVQERN